MSEIASKYITSEHHICTYQIAKYRQKRGVYFYMTASYIFPLSYSFNSIVERGIIKKNKNCQLPMIEIEVS